MAPPTTIPSLTAREAVADALYRCVLGIDTNDHALFESACVTDDSASLVAGPATLQGWGAISEAMERVFKLVTTHYISNVRVEGVQEDEDGGTASLTAHAIAYHVRPDEALVPEDTSYTAGCLYFVDLVREGGPGGLWKIKRWEIRIQWTTGDRAVVYG